MTSIMYDLIIIGGGPGGLTAAIYASRSGLKTLLIEKDMTGGKIAAVDKIENFPSYTDEVNGWDLSERMTSQAKKFGTEIILDEVISIDFSDIKQITTKSSAYQSKAVILAMGTYPRHLNLENEEKLIGRGISYCATCDGAFFKGKVVAVAGGANSAVSEALYLERLASDIHLIYRGEKLKSEKILTDKLIASPNIKIHLNSDIEKLLEKDVLNGVIIKNKKTGTEEKIDLSGLFVAIGHLPNTKLISEDIKLDEKGYIKTDSKMQTNIKGVFACGDIISEGFRQVITACGDGAKAAEGAMGYIISLK